MFAFVPLLRDEQTSGAPKPVANRFGPARDVREWGEQSATGWVWKLNQLRLAVFKGLQLTAPGCKIVICA
jgi:hypothetical protein